MSPKIVWYGYVNLQNATVLVNSTTIFLVVVDIWFWLLILVRGKNIFEFSENKNLLRKYFFSYLLFRSCSFYINEVLQSSKLFHFFFIRNTSPCIHVHLFEYLYENFSTLAFTLLNPLYTYGYVRVKSWYSNMLIFIISHFQKT